MRGSTIFQTILLAGSIVAAILGLIVFAYFGGGSKSAAGGPVVIWGTLYAQSFQNVFNTMKSTDKSYDSVSYLHRDPATYQADIINAIASGNSPDLVLITQEDIAPLANKLQVIPYASLSQSTFLTSYIDEGQLFLTPSGAIALPFAVDPMEMYWNRDMFATAGISAPPKYWSDLTSIAPLISKSDASGAIKQSVAPLGLWDNIDNVKELLSAIFMQAGDTITAEKNGLLVNAFGKSTANKIGTLPAESALRFYTDFANPSKEVYSWSRSMPRSRESFISGTTALYFGFASEYSYLMSGNPNIHLGVAMLPQVQGVASVSTYGRLYSLAIPRGAVNPAGAITIAGSITSTAGARAVIQNAGLLSGRRDIAIDTNASAIQQVAAQSALVARGWIDPSPIATTAIFKSMVESVVSGAHPPVDAVNFATQAFGRVFIEQQQISR